MHCTLVTYSGNENYAFGIKLNSFKILATLKKKKNSTSDNYNSSSNDDSHNDNNW